MHTEPGGYLQWEEVDRDTSGVLSKPMQRLEHVYSHFLEEQHLDPRYVALLSHEREIACLWLGMSAP